MADKQSLNETFFAFKKREKGGVLIGATIVFLVAYFALYGAFVALNWQGVVDYFSWAMSMSAAKAGGAPPSPEMMMPPASVMSLAPMYFLLMLFGYFLLAAYESAC